MQGRKEHFFCEYVLFTMPLLKFSYALLCCLRKANFTAPRSGAGGAHPHQPPHFLLPLLPIIPFYGLNCSWNSWFSPVLWLILTFLSLKSTKHTVLNFLLFAFWNYLLEDMKDSCADPGGQLEDKEMPTVLCSRATTMMNLIPCCWFKGTPTWEQRGNLTF